MVMLREKLPKPKKDLAPELDMFSICRSILLITRSRHNQETPTFAVEVAIGSDHFGVDEGQWN
jgi:hypothetical protein